MSLVQSSGGSPGSNAKHQLRQSHEKVIAHINSLHCASPTTCFEPEHEKWMDTLADLLQEHDALHFELLGSSLPAVPDLDYLWEIFRAKQDALNTSDQADTPMVDGHECEDESDTQAVAAESRRDRQEESRSSTGTSARTPIRETIIGIGHLPTPSSKREAARMLEPIEHNGSPLSKRQRGREPAAARRESPTASQASVRDDSLEPPGLTHSDTASDTTEQTSRHSTPYLPQRKDLPTAALARRKVKNVSRAARRRKRQAQGAKTYAVARTHKVVAGVTTQLMAVQAVTDGYAELLASADWLPDEVVSEMAKTSDMYVRLALLMRSKAIIESVIALDRAAGEKNLPWANIEKELSSDPMESAVRNAGYLQRALALNTLSNTQTVIGKAIVAEYATLKRTGSRLTTAQLDEVSNTFNLVRETVRDHRKIGDGALNLVRRHLGLLVFMAAVPGFKNKLLGSDVTVASQEEVPRFGKEGDVDLINKILGGEWARRACFIGQRIERNSILGPRTDTSPRQDIGTSLNNLEKGDCCSCEHNPAMSLCSMFMGEVASED